MSMGVLNPHNRVRNTRLCGLGMSTAFLWFLIPALLQELKVPFSAID